MPPKKYGDFIKLKNGQGWKDKDGNIWKRDKFHQQSKSEHWDVSDKNGKKIMEIK